MKRWNKGWSQTGALGPLSALKPWIIAIVVSLLIHSGLFAVIAVRSYVRRQTGAEPLPIGPVASRVEFFATGGDDGGGGDAGGATDNKGMRTQVEQVEPSPARIPEPSPPASQTPTATLTADLETNRELHADVALPGNESGGETGAGVGIAHGRSAAGAGIGGNDRIAAYARNPLPPYPREAREPRWQGTILLRVEVLADGNAGRIEIAESSGHSLLDEVTVQTVRTWKFLPAHSGYTPVRSLVEIPITFRMAE